MCVSVRARVVVFRFNKMQVLQFLQITVADQSHMDGNIFVLIKSNQNINKKYHKIIRHW